MTKYELITGIRPKAIRVALYGVAGIGKTTLAAEFPNPVFIDVEDGSNQLPVARLPRPTSWAMLMDEVKEVRDGHVPCSTIVIDTADAAETLCVNAVCSEHTLDGIESAGYGKGYTYLAEKFGKLLDLLGEVVDHGINVVVVSHSMARKFERPDEEGAYDRYELKLSRKVAPMVKEWADMLLFLDYKTYVETQSDKKGNTVKAKAKGGRRIIRTTHHPCWDAKNRFGLKDELPLEYTSIAHCVPDMMAQGRTIDHQPVAEKQPQQSTPEPAPSPTMQEVDARLEKMKREVEQIGAVKSDEPDPRDFYPARLSALADLMRTNGVTDETLRSLVGGQGWFPKECPVEQYPEDFATFLVSTWDQLMAKLENVPF